jgi:hypothetical protein
VSFPLPMRALLSTFVDCRYRFFAGPLAQAELEQIFEAFDPSSVFTRAELLPAWQIAVHDSIACVSSPHARGSLRSKALCHSRESRLLELLPSVASLDGPMVHPNVLHAPSSHPPLHCSRRNRRKHLPRSWPSFVPAASSRPPRSAGETRGGGFARGYRLTHAPTQRRTSLAGAR